MSSLDRIVVINIALAVAHQVDAAYWHEWEMFGLPGGIQLFVVLNLLMFVAVIACLVNIVRRTRTGFHCSLGLAMACGLMLPIHAAFWLAGGAQFMTPISVLVLVGAFAASFVQAVLTLRQRDRFGT